MKITRTPIDEKTLTVGEKKTIGRHTLSKPTIVRVKTVDGSIMRGSVNVAFHERVSDFFVSSEKPFFVLFDATTPGGGSGNVLIMNKAHVIWIEPHDEQRNGEDEKPPKPIL